MDKSEAKQTNPPKDEVKQPLMVEHQWQLELEGRLHIPFIDRNNDTNTVTFNDLINENCSQCWRVQIDKLTCIFPSYNCVDHPLFGKVEGQMTQILGKSIKIA